MLLLNFHTLMSIVSSNLTNRQRIQPYFSCLKCICYILYGSTMVFANVTMDIYVHNTYYGTLSWHISSCTDIYVCGISYYYICHHAQTFMSVACLTIIYFVTHGHLCLWHFLLWHMLSGTDIGISYHDIHCHTGHLCL